MVNRLASTPYSGAFVIGLTDSTHVSDMASNVIVGTNMDNHDVYAIALYYCYVSLDDKVSNVVEFHEPYSSCFGGRVRVSAEGLNGVLSGRREDLRIYEANLSALLSSYFYESFELDVKYCDLRPDLPVAVQLFTKYSVQKTQHVVQLVDVAVPNKASQKKKFKQLQKQLSLSCPMIDVYRESLASNATAEHLTPEDWNQRLLAHHSSNNVNMAAKQKKNIVIMDCRNSYESDIGHFFLPGATTVLTNTRKFSELPEVLEETKETLLRADEIYMYCTGGVRCERASGYLQTLLSSSSKQQQNAPTKVYQLHGGIQRYLERELPGGSLFRGKNFVFDPRRIDPHVGVGITGQCLVCTIPHDDYDNGHPPCDENEARCCKCRVLMLVCRDCRSKASCWGDDQSNDLPKLYCGISFCWHRPPTRLIGKEEEGH